MYKFVEFYSNDREETIRGKLIKTTLNTVTILLDNNRIIKKKLKQVKLL